MNSQGQWKIAYRQYMIAETYRVRVDAYRTMRTIRREAALERKLEAAKREINSAGEIIENAFVTLGYGDFKNGITDCSGSIDEGEVRAGRAFEAMRQWLLTHQTERNYIKCVIAP